MFLLGVLVISALWVFHLPVAASLSSAWACRDQSLTSRCRAVVKALPDHNPVLHAKSTWTPSLRRPSQDGWQHRAAVSPRWRKPPLIPQRQGNRHAHPILYLPRHLERSARRPEGVGGAITAVLDFETDLVRALSGSPTEAGCASTAKLHAHPRTLAPRRRPAPPLTT